MNTNALTPADRRRISLFFIKNLQTTGKAAAVVLAGMLLARAGVCRAAADADLSKLQSGMPLPTLHIQQDMSPEQRSYLGLRSGILGMFAGKGFKPSEIAAEVLVIEFFNVYCTSCQSQAPILNEVFQRVNAQESLRERVKFFGIGAGNNQNEVASYMRRYSIGFPLIADPDFINYEAIGEPGATPLTLVIKKNGPELLIVSAHAGLVRSADVFMQEIRRALDVQPEALAAQRIAGRTAKPAQRSRLDLDMSDEQVEHRVKDSMRKATDGNVDLETFSKQTYPRSGAVYVAQTGAAMKLFAQVISRPPTCDVCHGVHFIVVFDAGGTVRYFEPLHLTKYGNVEWNNHDVDFMRGKLIGLDVKKPVSYNPSVDSVTTATMTSVIIYNSVKRLKDVLDEIKESNPG